MSTALVLASIFLNGSAYGEEPSVSPNAERAVRLVNELLLATPDEVASMTGATPSEDWLVPLSRLPMDSDHGVLGVSERKDALGSARMVMFAWPTSGADQAMVTITSLCSSLTGPVYGVQLHNGSTPVPTLGSHVELLGARGASFGCLGRLGDAEHRFMVERVPEAEQGLGLGGRTIILHVAGQPTMDRAAPDQEAALRYRPYDWQLGSGPRAMTWLNGDLEYEVESVELATQLVLFDDSSRTPAPGASFVVVKYAVKNTGTSTARVLPGLLRIRDGEGAEFDAATFEPDAALSASAALRVKRDWLVSELHPGIATPHLAVFHIPSDRLRGAILQFGDASQSLFTDGFPLFVRP